MTVPPHPVEPTKFDPPGPDAIRLGKATKSFGSVRALVELDLRVRPGERVAILGPNGAGKTTTISLILGLATPDAGDVEVFGSTPAAATMAGRVGAMLQDGGLMRGVLVHELLAMLARQYRHPAPLHEVCELAQIGDVVDRRVDRLSGGQAQRVRLAIALIGAPELLVLDEPTAAMDPAARRAFWQQMDEQRSEGRTILFSTHYLEEADEHAERIVVLAGGRLVADGTPASIKASVGLRAVRFAADRTDGVLGLPGVITMTTSGSRVELRSTDSDATLRALLALRPDAHHIDVGDIGLEEAFLALTRSAHAA